VAHASIVDRADGDRAAPLAADQGLHSEVVCKWCGAAIRASVGSANYRAGEGIRTLDVNLGKGITLQEYQVFRGLKVQEGAARSRSVV
jgi:hypothetical protein